MNKFGFRDDFDFENRFDLKTEVDGYIVSTVDLGIDHSYGDGPPLYYETMIFKKNGNGNIDFSGEDYQMRYTTEEQAKEGHKIAIEYLKEKINASSK